MTKGIRNAIRVIHPYRWDGTWVFDDEEAGLRKEPFVCGIPEIIDTVVREIPGAESGFRLLFSDSPFPGADLALELDVEEGGGAWYRTTVEERPARGWLCPALLCYFEAPPERIHVAVEGLRHAA